MKVIIFFITFFLSFPSYSERIYFLNGDILTGEIWRETKQNTIIVTEHGSYKIISSKISKIDYEGKKKFRIVKRNGDILTAYLVESNQQEIYYMDQKEKSPKKMKWTEIFAIRIIK